MIVTIYVAFFLILTAIFFRNKLLLAHLAVSDNCFQQHYYTKSILLYACGGTILESGKKFLCRRQDQNGVRSSLSQLRFTCLELASLSSWLMARSSGGQMELDQKKNGHLDHCHPTIWGPEKSHLVTCPF